MFSSSQERIVDGTEEVVDKSSAGTLYDPEKASDRSNVETLGPAGAGINKTVEFSFREDTA